MSDEITYLEPDEVIRMNALYIRVMEQEPPSAKRASHCQLTALHFTLKSGRLVYADFGVFGKYGNRRARAMAFKGLVTAPGGTLHTVEILGPPTLEAWKESYDVLFTALIMLDVVRRPHLAAYRAKICALHAQYGPRCWALLYQADVRCRSEHMELIRFRLLSKHNAAMTAGTPSTYDTMHPWDATWGAAVVDTDFWKDEFETNAMLIRTGAARISDALGTDALTDPHAACSSDMPMTTGKPQPKAEASKKNPICKNYNFGTCHGTTCPDGHGKHSCSICGSPKHPAVGCPRVNNKGAPRNDEGSKKGKNGNRNNWTKKNQRK
jgi:hypothetical protein